LPQVGECLVVAEDAEGFLMDSYSATEISMTSARPLRVMVK